MYQSTGRIFLFKMCTGLQDTLDQSIPLKFRQDWGQQSTPLRQAASAFPLGVDLFSEGT